jgi:hypothetical protein
MIMKKLLLIILLIGIPLVAQENRHEKIKALKRAHITETLSLSPTEAEKFWPIYNVYEDRMEVLKKSERKELGIFKNETLESMTDAEANTLIDKIMELKSQEVQFRHELIIDLRKVLPPKKIILLKKAEDDFKRQLLKQIRQRKGKK